MGFSTELRFPLHRLRERDQGRGGERGSALIYILIAIALLALLTITFMEPASQQTQSQNTFKTVSELQSQVEFIRSSVQECVAAYFKGDATIDTASEDPGANIRYPINPDSDHFSASALGKAGDRNVKSLRCPGNPGDSVEHAPIFSSASGKFLPPPPEMFNDWQWYNGTDGIFFWIETDKTDAFIATALTKLEENYATCEADQIDATGGAAVPLDSDGATECASGSRCFRLWMVMNAGSAIFPDEAGCP